MFFNDGSITTEKRCYYIQGSSTLFCHSDDINTCYITKSVMFYSDQVTVLRLLTDVIVMSERPRL